MLLSNITSHPSLTPKLTALTVPVMIFPPSPLAQGDASPVTVTAAVPAPEQDNLPPYFFPHSLSASSTLHPSYRPDLAQPGSSNPSSTTANANAPSTPPPAKPYEVQKVDAVRALVQAFEDGAMAIEELASQQKDGEDGQGEGEAEGKVGRKGRGKGKRKGGVHFLGSVFANISMLPSTRPLLLLPYPPFPKPLNPENISPEDEPLLTKIVVFTEHGEIIRRGGALGCIK